MKRILFVCFAAASFFACAGGDRQSASKEELAAQSLAKDSIINAIFASLGDVAANLNTIKEREGIVTSAVANPEIGREPLRQISEDMSAIDRLLQENRETIEKLEKSAVELKKSNVRIGSLEKLITELTSQVESRDSEIAAIKESLKEKNIEVETLTVQVADMRVEIDSLSGDKTKLEAELTEQKDIAGTVYYIVGSRRELIDNGIVETSGFIGRTLKVNDDPGFEKFTRVDARRLEEVLIGQKGVQLVTSHPDDSYRFVINDKNVYLSLEIIDKAKFWEYSKVLVIGYR